MPDYFNHPQLIINPAVITHVISMLSAFFVSFLILFKAKGTKIHKMLGWMFTVFMLISIISSFWIKTYGIFSPIHVLSIVTIYWLVSGIIAVRLRRHNWQYSHAFYMGSAYIGILIAGLGVLVRQYIAPGDVMMGFIVSAISAAIIIPILIGMISRYKINIVKNK